MTWRNPEKEIPDHDQEVWCLLKPHKSRRTSMQIIPGFYDSTTRTVTNGDELGEGDFSLYFDRDKRYRPYHYYEDIIAWMPIEDMILPEGY